MKNQGKFIVEKLNFENISKYTFKYFVKIRFYTFGYAAMAGWGMVY